MALFTKETFLNHDDYMTPKSAWENIQHYIPKDKVIWEPFYGDGESGEYLRQLGFEVIHEQEDFFKNNRGDIIVSNPPFTKKKQVLTRLKLLDKPFIIICPSSMINTQYFQSLFGKENNIQIIIPKKRIQFIKDGITSDNRCNFDCFYYCYKMNLQKDIIFLSE